MEIGLVGLGKMGGGLATRLLDAGHRVVGCDLDPQARQRLATQGAAPVATLEELAGRLAPPRVVWLMLPAGPPTQAVIDDLATTLTAGDLVVDGGNSDFRHAPQRARLLGARDVGFADAGVSGGQWGWRHGYGITVGADPADYLRIEPALRALAADGAYARAGAVGAGHLAKAVHNGVEYGVMQAYAEGFSLLRAHQDVDTTAVMRVWQQGCSIRSFLLDQTVTALERDPTLEDVSTRVADSGMGRWTTEEAVRLAVPTPVMTAALHARFASRDDAHLASRLLSAARAQIGGHPAMTDHD